MLGFLLRPLARYTRWLHTQWPAGTVEPLPRLDPAGRTNVPGLWVAGDLTGVPLLKFAADSGARAVRALAAEASFARDRERKPEGTIELAIVGAGVAGLAAALEAQRTGIEFVVFEAKRRLQTIADFPARKPIYTYPRSMVPAGELRLVADVKEALFDDLLRQTETIPIDERRVERVRATGPTFEIELAGGRLVRALRVIVAIGRSGEFRRLGVPGEHLAKVHNRLHDPADFVARPVAVVGGGDSAVEAAVALARSGAEVTLIHRGRELSRPKAANLASLAALLRDPQSDVEVTHPTSERVTTAVGPWLGAPAHPGSLRLELESEIAEIDETSIVLRRRSGERTVLPNEVVFSMIGREPPFAFLRRAGVRLRGETRGIEWLWAALFFACVCLLFDWKSEGFLYAWIAGAPPEAGFPQNAPELLGRISRSVAQKVADRSTLFGTLGVSMKSPSFYYTLLYTASVGLFGWLRIRRRRTPYIRLQTVTLFLVQLLPLFLLPELILPWLGYNGAFDHGAGAAVGDAFFEKSIPDAQYLAHDWPAWGHPRAYWRAYGLILAWPLMVYNVFTSQPIWGWLVLSFLQTFVAIPLLVRRWGKGAFCGWICSCGALAETAGDTLRHLMPHGPRANRLNLVGQLLLLLAFLLLALRIVGWLWPGSWADVSFALLLDGRNAAGRMVNPLSWKWTVDVLIAGVLGVGLYVKYSGRVWCRFACPLAALMHVYARFSRFRILAEKNKCISCNACTAVCHQGIDVMSFANKGQPMADPQCVRCSACVESCPTGVLAFGRVDADERPVALDRLVASQVRAREA